MKLRVTKGDLIISIHIEMADGELPGGEGLLESPSVLLWLTLHAPLICFSHFVASSKKKDFFIVFQETVDVAPQLKTGSAWEQHQYYKLLKVKLVIMARMLAEPVLTPWLK